MNEHFSFTAAFIILSVTTSMSDVPDGKMLLAEHIRDEILQVADLDDRWFVKALRFGNTDTYLAGDSDSVFRDGAEWSFYRKSETGWDEWNALVYVRDSFFTLAEKEQNATVVYSPTFAPVDETGTIRTWDEHQMATNHFQVYPVVDTLRRISIGFDGIPHISTNENGIVSRLWSDSFQSLKKMNFDIYSGTNLMHSTLYPTNTAPVAPMPTAEEKSSFADWFRLCATTNGAPATNAVLAVFADDDLDGRMDAFATLNAPPDADGARRWAFCRRRTDGWLFFGMESPASVVAGTNEFFRFEDRHGSASTLHAIVVIRPNPGNPLYPVLPRDSDDPDPIPDGWKPTPAGWRRPFIQSYDELLNNLGLVKLERLVVESIP